MSPLPTQRSVRR